MREMMTRGRLLILYIIHRLKTSVSETQLIHFMLDNRWMSYFELQEGLYHLCSVRMLDQFKSDDLLYYRLCEEGQMALEMFSSRLNPRFLRKVDKVLSEKQTQVYSENEMRATYDRISGDEYAVSCKVFERDKLIFSLCLTVPSQEQAKHICKLWPKVCADIYPYVITQFAQDYK